MLAKRAAPQRPHGVANRVRIIGGQYRRRLLDFPGTEGLRPTPDRVRETLFNWLGQDLPGWVCLDLFAGSGALGFEAASRGAARVIMIERDAKAFHALERNRATLGAGQLDLLRVDALAWLANNRETFDLIFLDIDKESYLPALSHCRRLLRSGGLLVADNVGFSGAADFNRDLVENPAWRAIHLLSFLPRHSPEHDGLALAVKEGGAPDQLSATVEGLDRFRILAMTKLIRSGILNQRQITRTLEELSIKCRIYGTGCTKRGKPREGERYLHLPKKVEEELKGVS